VIRVELSDAARVEAQRIDAWWHDYRWAAPSLFRDELVDILQRLGATPLLGTAYEWDGPFEVRRVRVQAAKCVEARKHDPVDVPTSCFDDKGVSRDLH
jgi:hypothetical protein